MTGGDSVDKKVCFVVMGFGTKMDYHKAKKVNLDRVYEKVIKPLFEEEFPEYKLIRADGLAGSSVIDVGMYQLLLNADLVIADITTLNPNAIYELGVRHAVREFSTIIMAQEDCPFPFDISHSRCLTYPEIGEELDKYEAAKIKDGLKEFILESQKKIIDSPLYTFVPNVKPPEVSKEEYRKIISDAEDSTQMVEKLVLDAENFMDKSNFSGAVPLWDKLKKLLPSNNYFVQQLALATYKSKKPNETKALENALDIIKTLDIKSSLDLETLGLAGAIYKSLFKKNKTNYDYLDFAIDCYKKGYVIKKDYYNGENYANCLLLKVNNPKNNDDDLNYLKVEIKKVYEHVIELINEEFLKDEKNFWMYATLSVAYHYLGMEEKCLENKELFYAETKVKWQRESYENTIRDMDRVLVKLKT